MLRDLGLPVEKFIAKDVSVIVLGVAEEGQPTAEETEAQSKWHEGMPKHAHAPESSRVRWLARDW